jgi:hypothetical protein
MVFAASDHNGWARLWGLAQGREWRRTRVSGWSTFRPAREGSRARVPSVRAWRPREALLGGHGCLFSLLGLLAVTNCPTGREASARRRGQTGMALR